MTDMHETAYPRMKSSYTSHELHAIYSPTPSEMSIASNIARQHDSRFCFLLLLKVTQRLGYFARLSSIPLQVVRHVASYLPERKITNRVLQSYDASRNRLRHIQKIRDHLNVVPFDDDGHALARYIAERAADTKEKIPDIINDVLEELIKRRYELPAFSTISKIASDARTKINSQCYDALFKALTPIGKSIIDDLITPRMDEVESGWNQLKREPKKAKTQEIKSFMGHMQWLKSIAGQMPSLKDISVGRRRQYFEEALSLHANSVRETKENRKYALAIVLIQTQRQKALDCIADIFVKKIQNMSSMAELRLQQYHIDHIKRTEKLIARFRDVIDVVCRSETMSAKCAIDAIKEALGHNAERYGEDCDEFMAFANNNYWPFVLASYHQNRALLFGCLESLDIVSSTTDATLIRALRFVYSHRNSHKEWISIESSSGASRNQISLQWLPEQCRRLVTGQDSPSAKVSAIHRKYFEIFVFFEVKKELCNGDLIVVGSDKYSDYRTELIDDEHYEEKIEEYGHIVGLPTKPREFIQHLRDQLHAAADSADQHFPENEYLELSPQGPVIRKHETEEVVNDVQYLDQLLRDRIAEVSILDLLVEGEKWLDLHRLFGPISGFESKIDDPRTRFILTLFCYGCNLGPSQVAKSVKGFSRKQLAWLDMRHITEDRLDKAIHSVINAYNKFALPKYWGTGKSASADGTKWNLYEQNLISEYHIRYGGYGGIGYYHVSDQYIALFSRFIPCGVYEAIYILDIIQSSDVDIVPDTLHGDTQSQSTPVFALAFFLGIQLMPRIRGIKKLTFHRPDSNVRYKHIDALFTSSIDWNLIERHLPDMFRIVLSIKEGMIAPSTILRRLGTQSRKNKLYFAFREVGRVIRTIYLLKYINDVELRKVVHAATNKGEQFNHFTKWLFFGNEGIIAENIRFEQSKIIKYNQLVANLAILYNVSAMTRVLNDLIAEGHTITREMLEGIGPFRTLHINRLGAYVLNLKRRGLSPEYGLPLFE